MRTLMTYFFVVGMFAIPTILYSQSGELDLTFANGVAGNSLGYYMVEDFNDHNFINESKDDGNGNFIGIGTAGVNVLSKLIITKFTHAGIPDESFDNVGGDYFAGTFVNPDEENFSMGEALFFSDDGDYLALITFGTDIGGKTMGFLKISPEGEIDTTYGTNGLFALDLPHTNVSFLNYLEKDGFLYLVYTVATTGAIHIFSMDFDGNPNTSFGTNGLLSVSPTAYENPEFVFLKEHNSSLYLIANNVNGTTFEFGTYIYKYNLQGVLDTSYASNGEFLGMTGEDEYLINTAFDESDNLLACLTVYDIGQNGFITYFTKILPSGDQDLTFGVNGKKVIMDGDNEILDSYNFLKLDDNYYIMGYNGATTDLDEYKFFISKLDSNLDPDDSFGTNGFTKDFFKNDTFDVGLGDEYYSGIHNFVPINNNNAAILIGSVYVFNGSFSFGKVFLTDEMATDDATNVIQSEALVIYKNGNPYLLFQNTKPDQTYQLQIFNTAGQLLADSSVTSRQNLQTELSGYVTNQPGIFVLKLTNSTTRNTCVLRFKN